MNIDNEERRNTATYSGQLERRMSRQQQLAEQGVESDKTYLIKLRELNEKREKSFMDVSVPTLLNV